MAKTQIKNYVFTPGLGAADNLYPDAYNLLKSNISFIQKESTAYISNKVLNASQYTPTDATYNPETGELVLTIGSNNFNAGDAVLLEPDSITFDIAIPAFIQDKAYIIIDRTETTISVNVGTDADLSNRTFSAADPNAVSDSFFGYINESQEKCERDIKYNLDAYLENLRYGGNESIYNVVKYYWDKDVAQIDGSRGAELSVYGFIQRLIRDFILTNTEYPSIQAFEDQVINTDLNPGAEETNLLTGYVQLTIDVIENGLSVFPAIVHTGVGKIKIQGNYELNELLLISNVTQNEIIYSFNNPLTGGMVSLKKDKISVDPDFPKYLETTDALTTITLNYNTSNHSPDDELQIFVEYIENGKSITTTRPFDFGTDAIERMRVAQPLSMLDADFEYGLQPTKWAAIGTLRGYPSVYELPGTDTPVLSVRTDASTGTQGIGQSLITVTTIGAHGFNAGDAITIKALEDTVVGAARAEGSFIITEVPSSTTFTYYAKSKVGTVNGDILSTTYTQLRGAAFYTGASIGQATFDVASQGSAGTLTTELQVTSGDTLIPFDGPVPEIGAPLVNANIPVGSQVTGVRATSAGGGVYITANVVGDYPNGTTELVVDDATGIVVDLAADNGDGVSNPVISVLGNTIGFQNPFPNGFAGNTNTYFGIAGVNVLGIGTGAIFDISRSSGLYTVDSVVDPGQDYEAGDRILIEGTQLGGLSPDHDLVLVVTDTFSNGSVVSYTIEGAAFDGNATYTGINAVATGGQGADAFFDVTFEDNIFTVVDTGSPDASNGYAVNDRLIITGDLFPAGTSPANDLILTVTSVGAGGSITGTDISGVAPDAFEVFINPPFTTSGSGVGAQITVTKTGSSYSVNIDTGGANFLPGDTIDVLGSNLNGTDITNDLQITIDNVDGSGSITAVSATGIAANIQTLLFIPSTNLIGSGGVLTIETFNGTYNATVTGVGQDYGVNQTFFFPGTAFVGTTPTNDLTITITTTDATGAITGISLSGTAPSGSDSYTNLTTNIQQPIGTGAFFDVLRLDNNYSTTVNQPGQDYKVGNRIFIDGGQLGGTSPLNDLTIKVEQVVNNGNILNDSTAGISQQYIEASQGDVLDLYSTVTMSEGATSTLARGESIDFELLATMEINFANAHGLVPGDTFIVTTQTDDGFNNHALAAGSYFVTEVPAVDQLRYTARAAGTIDTGAGTDPVQGIVYPRPDSFFVHRPYDGGVQLGTGGPQHGAQAIRQSKKYIRYQSGKGIMYTTGALFAPSYDLRSVTSDGLEVGSTITIVTDDNDHGVQEGGIVRLLGVETAGYNSGPETAVPPSFDYEVINVVDERTFQVRSQRRLGATTAVLGFGAQMSVVSWHGATVRSGIFDDQNGIFWEYDGTQISVVQRTGTRQIAGTISIQVDNNLITGSNTRFRDQLKAGDRIIIKGMTHVVSHVFSQTEMTVTPDWRGVVDISGAKANLIVDKKTKQENFNIDRLDGTGPSGYDMDEAKMQMIGIQYSWYGAGFIDFMVRGADGNFVYAHRMRNSNVNTEAFMRSGNLPVRYEVSNEGPSGKLAEAMTDSQTTAVLEDSSFFPQSGTIYVDNEIMTFTGNDEANNTLTGLTRSATFQNFQAGATRNYTAGPAVAHDARTGVILISNTITPIISHWGSAFITDGMFDEDRGYIFSYAESGIEVSTTKQTAFLIRLAPSVSNALVGDLGERELLNRAQLLLQGLEITSDGESGGTAITGGIVVEGVLNPQNYPVNPDNIGWSELSGVAQGGQPSFAQVAAGGSVSWSTGGTVTTTSVTAHPLISKSITNARSFNNDDRIRILRSEIQTVFGTGDGNFLVGERVESPILPDGVTIRRLSGTFGSGADTYFRYDLTDNASRDFQVGDTINVVRGGDLTNRNFALFPRSTWDASGVVVGTSVSGGSVTFPANTLVNDIELNEFGGTEYYTVTFNNTFSGTLVAGSGTIDFEFSEPPYAQPGETVFSFIANPGERSTLDLSELKELTNTPLGGRGTFPNGPDVLAINVYKVSGAATSSNIILRWGEAQA